MQVCQTLGLGLMVIVLIIIAIYHPIGGKIPSHENTTLTVEISGKGQDNLYLYANEKMLFAFCPLCARFRVHQS